MTKYSDSFDRLVTCLSRLKVPLWRGVCVLEVSFLGSNRGVLYIIVLFLVWLCEALSLAAKFVLLMLFSSSL